jgi:hypothetical protein
MERSMVINETRPLALATTKQLLEELFVRYEEAIFIGHADDRVNPLQLACHFPEKSTGMHSVLTSALERVLTGLKRKYPGTSMEVPGLILNRDAI